MTGASVASTPIVGLLVIGQSPRPELQAEISRVAAGVNFKILGALDHLDEKGLAAASPRSDADTLFTTLPDGRSIYVSKTAVTKGLASRLDDLRALGAGVSLLCCTGPFPELAAPDILFASDLIAGAVTAAMPGPGKLGVFIPSPAQAPAAEKRWMRPGRVVTVVPLAPDAAPSEIDMAADKIRQAAPDLIVHDCISYRYTDRARAAETHGRPALLAATVCGRFVAELAGA